MRRAISVEELAWPLNTLPEAMDTLARMDGWTPRAAAIEIPSDIPSERLAQFLEVTAHHHGIEAEPLLIKYDQVDDLLHSGDPLLVRLSSPKDCFLAMIPDGHRAVVIDHNHQRHDLTAEELRSLIFSSAEAGIRPQIDDLLQRTGIGEHHREKVLHAIISDRLADVWKDQCWSLRPAPGDSFWKQFKRCLLHRYFFLFVASHITLYVAWLLSWWVIGKVAIQGLMDRGWLYAWILLLATVVPLRLLKIWSIRILSIGASGLVKRRLLAGALRLEPEEIRTAGAGHFLGLVIDSESFESMVINGGYLGAVAVIELLMACWVLAQGAGGIAHSVMLVAWCFLTLVMCRRFFVQRKQWTKQRVDMTRTLTERMVGHRTLLAQQPREMWHVEEDRTMEQYLRSSATMDKTLSTSMSLLPQGWLLVGLLVLVPGFTHGNESMAGIAVAFGGILFAYLALRKLLDALSDLTGAAIAWQNISPLFDAVARKTKIGSVASLAVKPDAEQPILEARNIQFQYPGRNKPAIQNTNLIIHHGDRLLMQGRSGSGKSTLASLLIGMREPQSGVLLLHGLDYASMGTTLWNDAVVASPQFHENYVISETFAFNLLMGRRWPPLPEDLQEAEEVCRELGLGGLIDRMPAGLMQIIGEGGWQLSHGEKSRLFIARTLLKKPDILILDENFAALDPENLEQSFNCVLKRASTLIVIAHP